MIIKEFELKLASRWGEFRLFDTFEAARKPRTNPVSVAFASLENAEDRVDDGKVIVDESLEKHWQVLEKEYSISRTAAGVLMILARKFPAFLNVKMGDYRKTRSIDFQVFDDGLEELTKAGVLDKTRKADCIEYELSHDLLSSVVFEKSFAEMRNKTQEARSKEKEDMLRDIMEKHAGDLFDHMDDNPFE